MVDSLTEWLALAQTSPLAAYVRAFLLVLIGYLAARMAAGASRRLLKWDWPVGRVQLVRRVLFWLVFSLFCVSALREAGFKLSVLLGAAGILSVAVGFASQTSASNFISGLFLTLERPFSVGDVIRVGTTTGEVLSIDLLSVKLRTYDNLMVRIPNETLIKSEMTTLTRFPIRRYDLMLGVGLQGRPGAGQSAVAGGGRPHTAVPG